MDVNYSFRKMKTGEADEFFHLILERMKWMDQEGMVHWNKYEYDSVYPLSYYEERCREGQAYVLIDKESNEILSGAVLLDTDTNWDDNEPCYYVHNFASKVGVKGAGSIFMEEVEKLAKMNHKIYVRLDVIEGCEKLANYYESRAYKIRGKCQSGNYKGVLREKSIV